MGIPVEVACLPSDARKLREVAGGQAGKGLGLDSPRKLAQGSRVSGLCLWDSVAQGSSYLTPPGSNAGGRRDLSSSVP